MKISIGVSESIREKVYRAIREQILDGTIASGDRIVETRLAQQIETSRTPVREALHMLEREGLLESIPRVGYRVKRMDWAEVEELCEIRAVNETLAAKWAISRITPAELKNLEENLLSTERSVRQGNVEIFVEKDAEFHQTIVRASGSERLMELCEQLRRHMLRYRIQSLYHRETALKAIEGHRRILRCLENKDKKGIGTAIRTHLNFAKRSIRHHTFKSPETEGLEADDR